MTAAQLVAARMVAAVILVAAVALPGAAVPAAAAPATGIPAADSPAKAITGYCAPGAGVSVVVDFAAFGKPAKAGCAKGTAANGVAAMRAAGFRVQTFTSGALVGICRIDDLPAPSVEKCDKTPPANAFWAYWQAPTGKPWGFAQQSATQSKPVAGTTEGWSFARGPAADKPAVAPTGEPGAPAAATPSDAARPSDAVAPAGGGGPSWTLIGGIALVVILILAGAGTLLWRRRSAG